MIKENNIGTLMHTINDPNKPKKFKPKWRKHMCQERGCKLDTYENKPFCLKHYEARLKTQAN